MSVKEEAMKTIESLAADVSWNDLLYTLYVKQQVADGMAEIEIGEFITHEEMKNTLLNANHMDA